MAIKYIGLGLIRDRVILIVRITKHQYYYQPKKTHPGRKVSTRIVTPNAPLQVLEMDIKYVWIAQACRYCYILTIIDTFTRFVLHWQVDFTIKSRQVKQAWENVIEHYLQAADLLNEGVHIEIRNDNGPQFGSKIIQEFFKENYLNQVFTHPYTPQKNGHIKSFHSILSKSIYKVAFGGISDLVKRLGKFYDIYNNKRLHSSIANLTPKLFWKLWNEKKISSQKLKNKTLKFSLNIPYQQIPDNENLKGVPCINNQALNEQDYLQKETNGSETL